MHIIFSPMEWGLGGVFSPPLLFADGSKSRSETGRQADKGGNIAKVQTKFMSQILRAKRTF